jgi:hypothetical protein
MTSAQQWSQQSSQHLSNYWDCLDAVKTTAELSINKAVEQNAFLCECDARICCVAQTAQLATCTSSILQVELLQLELHAPARCH